MPIAFRALFPARIPRVVATLVLAVAAATVTPTVSAVAAGSAPPWGACGRSTPEDKVVRQFPAGIILRCGGPIDSGDPRYGYRHILARHRIDFENMAFATGTFQNWRDGADFAMETIAADPDVSVPASGNQMCLSRVVFLNNRQTGQLVRQQIVVMYVDAATRNTVFPRGSQC